MALGLGKLQVLDADTGPNSRVVDLNINNIQRLEFDFGRSILIVQTANPAKRLEFQYDNLQSVIFTTSTNTVRIDE